MRCLGISQSHRRVMLMKCQHVFFGLGTSLSPAVVQQDVLRKDLKLIMGRSVNETSHYSMQAVGWQRPHAVYLLGNTKQQLREPPGAKH